MRGNPGKSYCQEHKMAENAARVPKSGGPTEALSCNRDTWH